MGTPPYPNDSLRYVAAEVRYPAADAWAGPVPPASVRDDLRPVFPVYEAANELNVNLVAGAPAAQQVVRHRFLTRDRLMLVTVGRESLTVETTSYPGWTALRAILGDVLRVVAQRGVPDGVLRIGLRYIDEIRVPDLVLTSEWEQWIDPRLAAPLGLHTDAPTTAQIALQYGEAPGFVTVMRAAPIPEGRTVQSEGPLRVPFETPDGPYFLLDTDSSWTDPDRQVPEFDVDDVMGRADQLHDMCIALYEASIGDQLRNEVLNQPRDAAGGDA